MSATAAATMIRTFPDPILEKVGRPVENFGSEELRNLHELLLEMMAAANGLGLAAPQIGIGVRAFVIRGFPDLFCNTVVASPSDETKVETEACLSLPGLTMPVERPVQIKLRWDSIDGEGRARKLRGRDARIAQHEHDHTLGTLITHRTGGF